MEKQKEPVAPVGEPFLVLELCWKRAGDSQQVALVASLPGRDSPKISRYHIGARGVSSADIEAIQADAGALLALAVETWCGIQTVLEM